MISLFIQWVTLCSAAMFCLIRSKVMHWNNAITASIAFFAMLLVTAFMSEAAFWTLQTIGYDKLLPKMGHSEFLFRNIGVASIVCALILRYFYIQDQWKRQTKAEMESRIQALQSRIRPHFLFNSMNTIANLTRSNPRLAEEVLEDFADLFRASLVQANTLTTLGEEIFISKQYLNIEALRLGERLTMEWSDHKIPNDALLPPLIFQPLLENAIYHGIEPNMEGGTIWMEITHDDGTLSVKITNTLPPGGEKANRKGNQIAMENIKQRMLAVFEGEAKLTYKALNNTYQVVLTFPYVNDFSLC
ncbi:MAG: histidine kinase [Methylococcales bacterium]|nr:histidine kinase [Methylococcales bacterium]